ncbi:hypothetical protein [Streptomyces sp. NPDC048650]|uniref:hypothetical protein n=1 Tax=unclassified Streptomyces TaxID=2593676 RepID=UPI003710DE0A
MKKIITGSAIALSAGLFVGGIALPAQANAKTGAGTHTANVRTVCDPAKLRRQAANFDVLAKKAEKAGKKQKAIEYKLRAQGLRSTARQCEILDA